MNGETYITTTQAAEILGVTKVRVWQLIKANELVAEKRGRDWFVLKGSIEIYRRKVPRKT